MSNTWVQFTDAIFFLFVHFLALKITWQVSPKLEQKKCMYNAQFAYGPLSPSWQIQGSSRSLGFGEFACHFRRWLCKFSWSWQNASRQLKWTEAEKKINRLKTIRRILLQSTHKLNTTVRYEQTDQFYWLRISFSGFWTPSWKQLSQPSEFLQHIRILMKGR